MASASDGVPARPPGSPAPAPGHRGPGVSGAPVGPAAAALPPGDLPPPAVAHAGLTRRGFLGTLAAAGLGAAAGRLRAAPPPASVPAAPNGPMAPPGGAPAPAAPASSTAPGPPFDLVIRGGRLIDPRQNLDGPLNLAIRAGHVAALGPDAFVGTTEIDATGLVVAPGFIDTLADNSHDYADTYAAVERYKLTDGVTTTLYLHGGTADVAEYYARLAPRPHWTHYGVSTKLMQIGERTADPRRRLAIAERCLAEGALALSHSVEYQPWPLAALVALGRLAARHNATFFLHLRFSDREHELGGVDEALAVAERAGCAVHIDHLHSTGGTWHMAEALDRIEAGRARGLRVTACVYPYTGWATYVSSRRFGPGWQQRYGLTESDLEVVGTGERLTPATFQKYRKNRWVLVAVPEGTMPLTATVLPALQRPWVHVASDGGIEALEHANNHPRGAGCFATALRLALDHGLALPEMVRKVTDQPAALLRARVPALECRGSLRVGDVADVTVFDPATVRGAATVANPNQDSQGIRYVLVAGQLAYAAGVAPRGTAGEAIRAPLA